ncbi:hypothetical protein LXL04_015684 [Taraxacum kok-saghyz]
MTTAMPTSEEDPILSVVRFTAEMSWAEVGPEVAEPRVTSLCLEAQECMIAGRWFDLASLMLTSAELVFPKASDKDLQCIFTIICNLVKKPESLDEMLEMAKLISTNVARQPKDKPALQLKLLFNLYNLLENPYSRFYVYMNALKLALNGKVIEHIISSFKKIASFLKEWNLGVHDQRELFLTRSNVLKEQEYLSTFPGDDAHGMEEAKEEAAYTIIEFVKAPDMFHVSDNEPCYQEKEGKEYQEKLKEKGEAPVMFRGVLAGFCLLPSLMESNWCTSTWQAFNVQVINKLEPIVPLEEGSSSGVFPMGFLDLVEPSRAREAHTFHELKLELEIEARG